MIIPYQTLPADTLQALLEEFVTREGTEYGFEEVELQTKVQQLQQQLKRGDIFIVFDPALETTSLVPKRDAQEAGLLND
ncbi:YheU family protein [Gilvimarinus xylanilyticus]|uniref:YheU family protein n=1 Tax=Gilvimarinus xylanilyticus TaxID=2944139 RepID=A0A9X2HVY4_9GAMM|nr:YheU family protein [Gilvimarinus xylanilyticus]MCP8899170.1 YheU family protein [Gilvimarinus xylanilyticus]